MNGPQQVQKFLSKNGGFPNGIIFMPRSFGYGAKLNRSTPQEIRTNAGLFLKGLKKEEELLRPDLLVLNYDLTYLAEIGGCRVEGHNSYSPDIVNRSLAGQETEWADFCPPDLADAGRLPIYREVLAILKKSTGTSVISLVPTPFTLAWQLAGDSFSQKCLTGDGGWEELMDSALYMVSDTVKVFLDAGSDGILFFEDFTGLESDPRYRSILLLDFYRTLYNILNHYQKKAIFLVQSNQMTEMDVYRQDQVAGLCWGDQDPDEVARAGFEQGRPVPGSGLRVKYWNEEHDFESQITSCLDSIDLNRPFIFSPLIPADARPERVQSLVREVYARKTKVSGDDTP